MITYPDKPWSDGQTFEHTTNEGAVLLGQYDAAKNTWIFRKKEGSGNVYTNTVYTVDVRPSDAQIEQAAAQFEVLPLPQP